MKLNIVTSSLILSFVGFFLIATLTSIVGVVSTPFSIVIRGCSFLLFLIFFLRVVKFNLFDIRLFEFIFVCFFLMYLVRIGYDTLFIDRDLSKEHYVYWTWTIGACMIPGLAAMKIDPIHLIRIQGKLSFILIGCSVLVIIFATSNFTNEMGETVDIGRINLTSLNPIALSTIGCLTILNSIFHILNKENKFIFKLFLLFGIIAGCYIVSASGARGPVVALVATIIFFISTLSIFMKILSLFFVLIGVYILYNIMILVQENLDLHSIDRFTSTGAANDASVLGRIQMFNGALNQFIEHPLTGSALEELTTKYYPHNLLLESLMSLGILGGIMFIYLNIYIILKSKKIMESTPNLRWIFGFHLFFFVFSFSSGAIWNSTYLWVSMGAAYSCIRALKLQVSV